MKHALSSAGRCFILLLVFLLALTGWTTASRMVKAAFSALTESKLLASDGAGGDYFGYSVSISGGTAVVGAYDRSSGAGAAYVFVKSGSSWGQQAILTPGDAAANDYFGWSVSISVDTVIIGAYNKNAGTGAAYIFTRSGTVWAQQAELVASDGATNDYFGYAVGVSGDTAVVGAYNRNIGTGAAYIYSRSGSVWSQQDRLSGVDTVTGDLFGRAVCIDGDTVVVGAPGNGGTGAAYVFIRTGVAWSQQARLSAGDAFAGDSFGQSLCIEGNTAVVGAPWKSGGAGAIYVFNRVGSVWSQQSKLTASDAAANAYLGRSVCVSGNTIAVGADADISVTGAVYIFTNSGSGWAQQSKLSASDAGPFSGFGNSVGMSNATLVVGAQWKNSGTGAAYVYDDSLTPPTTTTTPSTTTTTPPTTATPTTTTTTPPTTTTTPPATTTTPPTTTTTTPPTTTTAPPTTTTTPPTTTTTPPPPPPPPTTTVPPTTTTTVTTTTSPPTTTSSPTATTSSPTTTPATTTASTTQTTSATTTSTASTPTTTAPPANTSLPGATTGKQASDTTSTEVQMTGTPTSNMTTPEIKPTAVDDQTPLYVWIPLVIAAVILIGAGVFVIRRR